MAQQCTPEGISATLALMLDTILNVEKMLSQYRLTYEVTHPVHELLKNVESSLTSLRSYHEQMLKLQTDLPQLSTSESEQRWKAFRMELAQCSQRIAVTTAAALTAISS